MKEAIARIEGHVPIDVTNLLRADVEGTAEPKFSEDSLQKAREVLNLLVGKAWAELDEKVMECKVFEDRNRDTFEQVITDIARLGETIADFERLRVEATEDIGEKEEEIISLVAEFKKQTDVYNEIRLANTREMMIRRNDLAVFQFMMQLTKCKKGE